MATKKQPAPRKSFANRALAPIGGFNEMLFGNIKRATLFQYELAGDYVQFPLDLMQATVDSGDLKTILTKQRDVARKFVEKSRDRREAFRDLAIESRDSFTQWVKDSAAAVRGKSV